MDINDVRVLITVLTFVAFVAIVVWAWSGRRRQEFDEAARMALDDDEPDDKPYISSKQGSKHGLQ